MTTSAIGPPAPQQPRLQRIILERMSDAALADVIVTAVDLLKRRERVALAKVTLAGEIEDLKVETLCRSADGAEAALCLVEQDRLTPRGDRMADR